MYAIPGKYLENPPGSTSRPKAGAGRRRKAATPRRGESGKAGRINPPPISVLQIHASGIPPGGQRHPLAGKARSHKSLPPFFPNPQLPAPKPTPQARQAKQSQAPLYKAAPTPTPPTLPTKKCQQSTLIPPPNSPKSATPVPHYLACCRQSRYIAPNQGAGTPPKRRRIPSKTAHA